MCITCVTNILIHYVLYCVITAKRVVVNITLSRNTLPCFIAQENFLALHDLANLLHVESPTFASAPYRDN